MNRLRIASIALLAFALAGCGKDDGRTLQGWVEADLVFISADEHGRIETLNVREGDLVQKAAELFTLDDDMQQADLTVKKATVTTAQQAFDRAKELLKTAAGTQKNYDDAEAALRQANANLAASQTRLTRRRVFSPNGGTIQQVYFRPGETVPASRAVVSLLPPQNKKIRFFAPQAMLPELKYGQVVEVSCDSCEQNLTATISFIAQNAEFTPPVIYSQEERAKLVFLVEALPQQPDKFRVGQPVSVRVPKDGAK